MILSRELHLIQLFSRHYFNFKGINTANISLNTIMNVHCPRKQTIKGIIMDQKEIYLKEWEKRYDSYLSYKYQYLFVSAIMAVIVSGSFTLAFAFKFDEILKIILLSAPPITMLVYYFAHRVAEIYLLQLDRRLSLLQKRLRMGNFQTVGPLLFAVRISQLIGAVSFVIFFGVLSITLLGMV